MGLNSGVIRLLIRSISQGEGVRGLTYGVQAVEGDFAQINESFSAEGVVPTDLPSEAIQYDDITHYGRSLHQTSFLQMFGYKEVHSLDAYGDENPTYVLDLNKAVPADMHESYDLVLDGGTMEHCFDVPTILENTINLLKPGGRVVHVSPVCGWVNHGFYQFSPTLFSSFYGQNGFTEIKGFLVVKKDGKWWGLSLEDDFLIPSQSESSQCLLFFTAKKGEGNKFTVPYQFRPEQHTYVKSLPQSQSRFGWIPEDIKVVLRALGAGKCLQLWRKYKDDTRYNAKLELLK